MTVAPALDHRLAVAAAVAREAGLVARRHFCARPAASQPQFKSHLDYVCAVDGEVERLIAQRLARAFPDDAVFGEEQGGRIGDRTWIIDPIDGTANFVRGIAHFCISLAYVREGRIEVGVIYDPIRDELFSAARGQGACLDGRPIAVSGLSDLTRATVETGWSTRLPLARWAELVARLAAAGAGLRSAGSGALGLAYVAAGRIDAYCELHINAWDAAAGLILVAEAGGWTNDFLAGDGLTAGAPVLAATPALAPALQALTGIGQKGR